MTTKIQVPEVSMPAAALATGTPFGSKKYQFIDTQMVVNTMKDHGWYPAQASQARTLDPQRQGYQKHLIRFRQLASHPLVVPGTHRKLDEVLPEVLFQNSHDTRYAPYFMAGLFRLVCINGLVVAECTFEAIRFKHTERGTQHLLDALGRVTDGFPRIAKRINTYREIDLTPDERGVFAEAAAEVRWPEAKSRDGLDLKQLLEPKRSEDAHQTLWTTFNILQERLLQGGVNFSRRRYSRTSKGLTSLAEQRRVNTALWTMMDTIARTKLGEN